MPISSLTSSIKDITTKNVKIRHLKLIAEVKEKIRLVMRRE